MTDDERNERIEARLQKIIDRVPGEEGWGKGNGEAFMDAGRLMLRLGVGLTEIENHLNAMYWEVASEYGA